MPRGQSYPVKELRERLGLSQEGLARLLNVSTGSVHRWESGRSNPLPVVIEKLEALEREAERKGKKGKAAA